MSLEDVIIRPLQTQDDYQQCVTLQHQIWGANFGESVPPSILMSTQKVGGVAAGAFSPEGRLLGFVFGLSGVRDGRLAHWSDMLGVREQARDLGLGQRLKAYQREQLLEVGIEVAYWTYDPLEARNANMNVNKLGALPVEYVTDMYGEQVPGSLLAGLSTDRFVVGWELRDPRVEEALAGRPPPLPAGAEVAPVANTQLVEGALVPTELDLPDDRLIQIEVPADIHRVKRNSMDEAREWRLATRRAVLHFLARGYEIVGFRRDREADRSFYVLASSA